MALVSKLSTLPACTCGWLQQRSQDLFSCFESLSICLFLIYVKDPFYFAIQQTFCCLNLLASIAVFICLTLQISEVRSSANQPSLEIIPSPPEEQSERNLIYLRRNYNASMWSHRIEESLIHYYSWIQNRDRIYRCTYDQPAPKGFYCEVDMRLFGECAKENYFSYERYSPCVFLKIKPTRGWIPEFYNSTTDLPKDMPNEIKSQINDALTSNNLLKLQKVWVSCDGDWAADKEFIGPVEYYPERGYPGFYFPMEDESNYLNPLVAIRFRRPAYGVIINIECRLWAKNIQYDQKTQLGSAIFQLLID